MKPTQRHQQPAARTPTSPGSGASAARTAAPDMPTPTPRRRASDRPDRPGPLVVNLPAGKADHRAVPSPNPPDLRLPHERDQSAVDSTADTPDPMVVQAARDLDAGLVDTDLHNPPGLDAARRHKLLKPPG